jgi:hypothetical protein
MGINLISASPQIKINSDFKQNCMNPPAMFCRMKTVLKSGRDAGGDVFFQPPCLTPISRVNVAL